MNAAGAAAVLQLLNETEFPSGTRSQEAKLRHTEDLLDAARTLAAELGGVRHVTLAAVTEAAGLHPSAVRRYFDSKEDLLLELAERCYSQWRDMVTAQVAGARDLTLAQTAAVVAATLAAQPLFCDLLTHVPLNLEGEVSVERARRYKTNAFAAFDDIVEALTATGTMTTAQVHDLLVTANALAANLWQMAYPTPPSPPSTPKTPAGANSRSTSNHG